jgi:TRAP-type C4-dicarboxylate transport system permease small subunit
VDIVIQALKPGLRKFCLIVASLLMIYATWLILLGSIDQTLLNIDASAPATGMSQAWFFGVGIIFAISTGIILLHQLYVLVKTPAAEIDAISANTTSGAD